MNPTMKFLWVPEPRNLTGSAPMVNIDF